MSGEVSEAAEVARARLAEEIERVRVGVEEMLDENGAPGEGGITVDPGGQSETDLRAELEELRMETRNYVKRRVRKSEKRVEKSVREIAARADQLEQRIDQVEADRARAEVRIHNDTERMLDGLLGQVRSIADQLTKLPAPAQKATPTTPARKPTPAAQPPPAPAAAKAAPVTPPAAAPAAKRMPSPQVAVGRVGPRVAPRRPAQ